MFSFYIDIIIGIRDISLVCTIFYTIHMFVDPTMLFVAVKIQSFPFLCWQNVVYITVFCCCFFHVCIFEECLYPFSTKESQLLSPLLHNFSLERKKMFSQSTCKF